MCRRGRREGPREGHGSSRGQSEGQAVDVGAGRDGGREYANGCRDGRREGEGRPDTGRKGKRRGVDRPGRQCGGTHRRGREKSGDGGPVLGVEVGVKGGVAVEDGGSLHGDARVGVEGHRVSEKGQGSSSLCARAIVAEDAAVVPGIVPAVKVEERNVVGVVAPAQDLVVGIRLREMCLVPFTRKGAVDGERRRREGSQDVGCEEGWVGQVGGCDGASANQDRRKHAYWCRDGRRDVEGGADARREAQVGRRERGYVARGKRQVGSV